MATLQEDRQRVLAMSVAELETLFEELSNVDVEMAWGGKNKGHETIQQRFSCWRKGTPRIDIETEILQRIDHLKGH